jgi:hypothetical protein
MGKKQLVESPEEDGDWKAIARAVQRETDHRRIAELLQELNKALREHSWTRPRREERQGDALL